MIIPLLRALVRRQMARVVLAACVVGAYLGGAVMAWQEGEPVPGRTVGEGGAVSEKSREEICKDPYGAIVKDGVKYGLLPFDAEQYRGGLGEYCERLYLSCVSFQSYFYKSTDDNEKCITVENVACVDNGKIALYKKIALYFRKETGEYLRVEAEKAAPPDEDKLMHESGDGLYYMGYFCDMARRPGSPVKWVDIRTHREYDAARPGS